MRLIPSDTPTVKHWEIRSRVPVLTRTAPDGTTDYDPEALVFWHIAVTMSDGEEKQVRIGSPDAEHIYAGEGIEHGPFGGTLAGHRAQKMLTGAGLKFPEYEYDEEDF